MQYHKLHTHKSVKVNKSSVEARPRYKRFLCEETVFSKGNQLHVKSFQSKN